MKYRFSLFLLVFCLSGHLAADDFDSLMQRFRAAAAFDHEYPREQVVIHTDNSAYLEGETLWFKAYTVRASSLRQAPLSRVLYVELLNDEGAVMERKLVRLDSLGTGSGEFKLVPPIHSGFHELRAYTREMLNWGNEACFTMVVPVMRRSAGNGTDEEALEIERPQSSADLSPGHARPYRFGRNNATELHCYPEGGHRVAALPQRIAFRLSALDGTPRTDSLLLLDSGGKRVCAAATRHDGMGLIEVPANMQGGTFALGSRPEKLRFPLPAPDSVPAVVMRADPLADGTLLRIESATGQTQLTGIAVTCRDRMCYFDTLTLAPGAVEFILPHSVMHDGVNRIDLFTPDGRSLASRSVWKDSGARNLRLAVEQSGEQFAPCSPIALRLRLTDENGRGVAGRFSLSVRDAEGEISAATAPPTDSRLLLEAGTEGYVDAPQRYLDADDETHRALLDLLMLTRAWHANSFETLCGTDTFRLLQPIEESLTLNGQVLKDNNRRTPLADYALRLRMMSKAGESLSAETVTDSLGRFAFASNVDYTGEWLAQFTTKDDRGRRRWSRITIDRWFAPDVRPFDGREMSLTPPQPATATTPAVFAWTDTIPNTVPTQLGEALVTTKKRYRGLTGGRYTYMGGEAAGIRIADTYYNIHRERERLLDSGIQVGSVGEILSRLNNRIAFNTVTEEESASLSKSDHSKAVVSERPEDAAEAQHGAEYIQPMEEISYGASRFEIFINNAHSSTATHDVSIDEVKSAVIVMDPKDWWRFLPGNFDRSSITASTHGLFIYSDPEAYMFRSRRGVEKRHITGYSIPARFKQPDYRSEEAPNPDDLRRTLLWQPEVTTDAEGYATVIVYSNARPDQRIRISARGFTADGRLIHFEQ